MIFVQGLGVVENDMYLADYALTTNAAHREKDVTMSSYVGGSAY